MGNLVIKLKDIKYEINIACYLSFLSLNLAIKYNFHAY